MLDVITTLGDALEVGVPRPIVEPPQMFRRGHMIVISGVAATAAETEKPARIRPRNLDACIISPACNRVWVPAGRGHDGSQSDKGFPCVRIGSCFGAFGRLGALGGDVSGFSRFFEGRLGLLGAVWIFLVVRSVNYCDFSKSSRPLFIFVPDHMHEKENLALSAVIGYG